MTSLAIPALLLLVLEEYLDRSLLAILVIVVSHRIRLAASGHRYPHIPAASPAYGLLPFM
jgi:hypothetical protein